MIGENNCDPNRSKGAIMNTLTSAMVSAAECRRKFGIHEKIKGITVNLLRVFVDKPPSGRLPTSLEVRWTMIEGQIPQTTVKTFNLKRIKAGAVDKGTSNEIRYTTASDPAGSIFNSSSKHDSRLREIIRAVDCVLFLQILLVDFGKQLC